MTSTRARLCAVSSRDRAAGSSMPVFTWVRVAPSSGPMKAGGMDLWISGQGVSRVHRPVNFHSFFLS
ncbi:MAG: hypothetical protein ACTSXP_14945 [Promethearchaeota archaeon]